MIPPRLIVAGVMLASAGFAYRHRPHPARLHAFVNETVSNQSSAGHGRRLVSAALLALVLVTTTIIGGPLAAVAVISIALVRPRVAAERRRRRERAEIASAYPDFVDLFVLTIRSGCTPVQTVRVLAPTAATQIRIALNDIDRRVTDGARFADAIGELPVHLGVIARPLADGLAFADRHGTPIGPMLDRLADEARAQRRRNSESSARQLPVRLSFPLVGCTLPSFVLLTIVPLMAGTLSSFRSLRP